MRCFSPVSTRVSAVILDYWTDSYHIECFVQFVLILPTTCFQNFTGSWFVSKTLTSTVLLWHNKLKRDVEKWRMRKNSGCFATALLEYHIIFGQNQTDMLDRCVWNICVQNSAAFFLVRTLRTLWKTFNCALFQCVGDSIAVMISLSLVAV